MRERATAMQTTAGGIDTRARRVEKRNKPATASVDKRKARLPSEWDAPEILPRPSMPRVDRQTVSTGTAGVLHSQYAMPHSPGDSSRDDRSPRGDSNKR